MSVPVVNGLEGLSTELLLMVIRRLPKQQDTLSNLRLVSRRLNSIVTPLKYSHIYQLSDSLIELSSRAQLDSFHRKLLANYRCYTRHVRIQRGPMTSPITSPVSWNKVLHFLFSLEQFQFLRYFSSMPP